MKIIQIGSFPKDIQNIRGGIEASIYGLAKTQSMNHEIYVLDFPGSHIENDFEEKLDGIIIYRYRLPKRNNISSLLRINDYYQQIKRIAPDVCHFHGSSVFVHYLYKLLKKNGFRCIVTIHGLVHVEKKKALKSAFNPKLYLQYVIQSFSEFRLISAADKLIVDTEYVKKEIEAYRKYYKISRVPDIHVIPQGIDEIYFKLNRKKSGDSFHLLSVGAFVERKGHHLLIDSFAKLSQNNKTTNLTIVGTLTDKLYYNRLVSLVEKSGLEDKVTLLPNVDIDDLHSMYEEADLFVLHSMEESQGIVFAEALAVGLPIVSTNVGGIPYVVNDGRNGLLSDYGDIDAFVENISKIISDEDFAHKIAENNIVDSNRYSWKKISEEIEQIYCNL